MKLLDHLAKPIAVFLSILFLGVVNYGQAPSPSLPPIIVQQSSKDFWDYLLIIVQMVTLVGLLLYVYKTWQIATATKTSTDLTRKSTELSQESIELSHQVLQEMRAARGQEIAPHVLTYIDMPYGNWVLFFVVKNIGGTVAKDIKFNFDPPLQNGFGNRVRNFEVSFLKDGIKSLAPGQELRLVFDSITNYFDGSAVKMLDGSLPTSYAVSITYKGGYSLKNRTHRIR